MQVLLQPTTLIDEADKELQSFTLKDIGQISPISRSLCFEAHESDWSRYYKQSVYETQCWTPEARTDRCPRTVDDSCGNGFEKAAAKAKKATWDFLSLKKSMTCSRWYEVEQALEKMQRRVHKGGIKNKKMTPSFFLSITDKYSFFIR